MAKLRKLVTYTDYRWEEAEITEEQAFLFESDNEKFMENYCEGEYDLEWDLVKEKCLQDEESPELIK